jgi:DNA replication protein DnaC
MTPKDTKKSRPFPSKAELRERIQALGLHGIDAAWDELEGDEWLTQLVEIEEHERARRSLERRIRSAKTGKFKPIGDFDWTWARKIDRGAVEDLFQFEFIKDGMNVVLIGPNGVGKTTIAQNLVHSALLAGHTARFVTASEMLNDLAAQDGRSALKRRIARFVRPALLAIDEVGYLSYGTHHADLMFDIVNRRASADRSTIVTTNKPFQEWEEVFPNSAAVVALVDRLVHRSEILEIDAASFRLKEAKEQDARRKAERAKRKSGGGSDGK